MDTERSELYDELIVKFMTKSITSEELLQLKNWLKESKLNQLQFDQTREFWLSSKERQGFDYNPAFRNFKKRVEFQSKGSSVRLQQKYQFSLIKIAAIVVIALLIGAAFQTILYKSNTNTSQYQEIIVPFGSKSKVLLPDGTSVVLNAGSKIRYHMDYGKKQRLVYLDGEGFFEVAKDKKHPFIVKTDFINIKALGTSFNVKAYAADNKVETTLVEGLVEIQRTKTKNDGTDKEVIYLKPKQRYTYLKKEIKQVEQKSQIAEKKEEKHDAPSKILNIETKKYFISEDFDLMQDISWKDKRWVINREQLEELAVKLGRRYDVNIRFEDESLKKYRYSGSLEDESLEQVLKVMSLSSPLLYEVNGKNVIFRENKAYLKKYKDFFQAEK